MDKYLFYSLYLLLFSNIIFITIKLCGNVWTVSNHNNNIKEQTINFRTFSVIGFHILYFMMLWCLIVTMNTHPGEIPLYWV